MRRLFMILTVMALLSLPVMVQAVCTNTVTTFPYNEDFEGGQGYWVQSTADDMDWTWQTGSTVSSGTGPSGDHTSGAGYYMYTETSSGNNNIHAILDEVCFDLSGLSSPEMRFYYHMYGATMGTINVDASTDGGTTWTNIWTLTGDQGDAWHLAVIDLSAYTGTVEIRFDALTGSSYTADSAIDDIYVGEGLGATPTPTVTPTPDAGDWCTTALSISCGDCIEGSTVGYTNLHDCGSGHEGADVVYELVLAQAGDITIIGEADWDADWTIATTCDATTGDIVCADTYGTHQDPSCGTITHNTYGYMTYNDILPAGTYYIWIDAWTAGETGNYALEVLCDFNPTPTPTITPTPTSTPALMNAEDFSTGAPGWTLDGSWETGLATASTGCSGDQDPDYDFTGEGNVLGYAIGDCYTNDMATTEYATSPVYDFTGMVDIHLAFARWLGVESASYDHAYVEVSNDGGTTWNIAWENPTSSMTDGAWTFQDIDISGYADNESTVQVRFGMGVTDGSVAYCGWNLDYVGFTGGTPGYIDGIVSSAGGPVAGATVSVDGTSKTAVTNGSGAYSIAILPGTYDMTVTAAGYNDATATGVIVAESATTTQNFTMTAPDIDVSPLSHSVTLAQPATDTRTVTITNTGDGELTYNLGFTNFGESKALWDELFNYDLETVTGDNLLLGTEFMNGHIWITGAAGDQAAAPNYLYEISADGTTLLNSYNQAASAETDWGYRDMANDGTYLYAGCGTSFYQIDPSDGSVVNEITHSLGIVIRALAYNPVSGTFYTGEWSSDIYEFSYDGSSITQVRSFNLGLTGKYGMAWDDVSAGGPYLWVNDAGSVYQIDPGATPALTGLSYEYEAGATAGGLFCSDEIVFGKLTLGAFAQTTPDTLYGLELGDVATWVSPDVTSGTVAAGLSDVITLTFDSNEVVGPGTYTCDMNIMSNDGDENPVTVDLEMIVTGGGTLDGTVLDGFGVAVNGATVEIVELGRTQTTNASGTYQFVYVPAGTYTVRASMTGYITDEATGVVVVNSVTTTQNFTLENVVISVNPTNVYHWQPTNNTETVTGEATIGNSGSTDLNWTATITYDGATWSDVTPVGTAMQWPVSTTHNGLFYCIGGLAASAPIGNVQIYDPSSGTWTAGTAIPTPVFAATCVTYNDQIFVFGGFADGSFTATDAVQIYDILGDSWSTGTVMPSARGGNCGDIIGDYAYVVGGSVDSNFPADNVCYEYDLINDTWNTLDDAPIASTYGIALGGAVAHNGLLYAGCHFSSAYAGWNVLDPTQPTGSQWTALTAPPSGFGNMTPSFLSVTNMGGIVGFGAGYDWTSTGTTYLYDPVGDTWTDLNLNMSVAAHGGAAGYTDGVLYFYGGTNGSLIDPPPFMELNTYANGWLSLSSMSGTVSSLTSEDIDFTYDSTGLPDGNYDAFVTINSNDPGTAPVIHVDFDVADTQPTPAPLPATGPIGVGMLLLIIGTLIGVATIRKQ